MEQKLENETLFDAVCAAESDLKEAVRKSKEKKKSQLVVINGSGDSKKSDFGSTTMSSLANTTLSSQWNESCQWIEDIATPSSFNNTVGFENMIALSADISYNQSTCGPETEDTENTNLVNLNIGVINGSEDSSKISDFGGTTKRSLAYPSLSSQWNESFQWIEDIATPSSFNNTVGFENMIAFTADFSYNQTDEVENIPLCAGATLETKPRDIKFTGDVRIDSTFNKNINDEQNIVSVDSTSVQEVKLGGITSNINSTFDRILNTVSEYDGQLNMKPDFKPIKTEEAVSDVALRSTFNENINDEQNIVSVDSTSVQEVKLGGITSNINSTLDRILNTVSEYDGQLNMKPEFKTEEAVSDVAIRCVKTDDANAGINSTFDRMVNDDAILRAKIGQSKNSNLNLESTFVKGENSKTGDVNPGINSTYNNNPIGRIKQEKTIKKELNQSNVLDSTYVHSTNVKTNEMRTKINSTFAKPVTPITNSTFIDGVASNQNNDVKITCVTKSDDNCNKANATFDKLEKPEKIIPQTNITNKCENVQEKNSINLNGTYDKPIEDTDSAATNRFLSSENTKKEGNGHKLDVTTDIGNEIKPILNTTYDDIQPAPSDIEQNTTADPNSTFEYHQRNTNKKRSKFDILFGAEDDDDEDALNRTCEVVGNGSFIIEGKCTNLIDMECRDLKVVLSSTPVSKGQRRRSEGTPTSLQIEKKKLNSSRLLKRLSGVGPLPKGFAIKKSIVVNVPSAVSVSQEANEAIGFPGKLDKTTGTLKKEVLFRLRKNTGSSSAVSNGPFKAMPLLKFKENQPFDYKVMGEDVNKRAVSTPINNTNIHCENVAKDSTESNGSDSRDSKLPSFGSISSIETDCPNSLETVRETGVSTPEVFRQQSDVIDGPRVTSTPSLPFHMRLKCGLGMGNGPAPTPIAAPHTEEKKRIRHSDSFIQDSPGVEALCFSSDKDTSMVIKDGKITSEEIQEFQATSNKVEENCKSTEVDNQDILLNIQDNQTVKEIVAENQTDLVEISPENIPKEGIIDAENYNPVEMASATDEHENVVVTDVSKDTAISSNIKPARTCPRTQLNESVNNLTKILEESERNLNPKIRSVNSANRTRAKQSSTQRTSKLVPQLNKPKIENIKLKLTDIPSKISGTRRMSGAAAITTNNSNKRSSLTQRSQIVQKTSTNESSSVKSAVSSTTRPQPSMRQPISFRKSTLPSHQVLKPVNTSPENKTIQKQQTQPISATATKPNGTTQNRISEVKLLRKPLVTAAKTNVLNPQSRQGIPQPKGKSLLNNGLIKNQMKENGQASGKENVKTQAPTAIKKPSKTGIPTYRNSQR